MRHLKTAGAWLLPEFIQEQLDPDTTLLIAPHRGLHRLPWAALAVGAHADPLAVACIPVLVPSWRTATALWQRPRIATSRPLRGAAVLVADFNGRHQSLPGVNQEIEFFEQLVQMPATEIIILQGMDATFEALLRLAQEKRLAQLDFLHIATHAFAEGLTGRLSALAFAGRDVWLDELWRLEPLPPLVTLSACSGLASQLYPGDEPVGLAPTLLAAGAQRVLGSLWAVADVYTPGLVKDVYCQLLAGKRPAASLALAQRQAWLNGSPAAHWGSFHCVGRP
jgi:CHAT domain-containing protein